MKSTVERTATACCIKLMDDESCVGQIDLAPGSEQPAIDSAVEELTKQHRSNRKQVPKNKK